MTEDKHTPTRADLLPCPFCGGEGAYGSAHYSPSHEAWWDDGTQVIDAHFVSCVKCGGSRRGIIGGHQTKALAAEAWNTRQAEAERDEALEALEKAEAAIARATEGDGGMARETMWNSDGAPSKHDRCPHGHWMYEGCQTCADAVLDPVLDEIIRPILAKHGRGQ